MGRPRGYSAKTGGTQTDGGEAAFQATVQAMQDGIDIITQATLKSTNWFGRADILHRVATESALGDWSYEVVDTNERALSK